MEVVWAILGSCAASMVATIAAAWWARRHDVRRRIKGQLQKGMGQGAPFTVSWLRHEDVNAAFHSANTFPLVVTTSLPVKSTDANLDNWSFVKGFYIWLGEDGHLNLHPVPDNRTEAKARYREQTQGKGIDGSGRTDCPS